MIEDKQNIIYFPVDQGEQARQPKAENLLAREVFEGIGAWLKKSLSKLSKGAGMLELDEHRAHETILIHGGRGAGKSSILVNLELYLNDDSQLRDQLLILKPVDPTLLENGDDLFLNIIVAALIRDKQIKSALAKSDYKTQEFYEQLQSLGAALEGVQKQKTEFGLDKLRAFIGNHGIAEEVHKLFFCALQLTGKRLVVLPIDDVDTSLQHAFENLEVIRKYLASPYVLPVVSGDLELYDDVTWRNFYQRIVDKNDVRTVEAEQRSRSLSIEYQRKVLPLPRRINVPGVTHYLRKKDILLAKGNNSLLSFSDLHDLLTLILNGAVNGRNNSYLELPVSSIRELSQLIISIGGNLADLAPHLSKNERSVEVVRNGHGSFNQKDQTPYFHHVLTQRTAGSEFDKFLSQLVQKLEAYFSIHDKAGAAYLVAQADQYWFGNRDDSEAHFCKNPLDTPLFKPLEQSGQKFAIFKKEIGLKESWTEQLSVMVRNPKWLRELPEQTILPYPNLDFGMQVSKQFAKPIQSNDGDMGMDNPEYYDEFLRQLLIQEGPYSSANNGALILIGRVFELLIASLIQDITTSYIKDLLQREPFFSATLFSLDAAGVFQGGETERELKEDVNDDFLNSDDKFEDERLKLQIDSFVGEINSWRKKEELNLLRLSPWLVYCVFQKVFERAFSGSSKDRSSSQLYSTKPPIGRGNSNSLSINELQEFVYVVDVGVRTFHAICADFGSFEKGSFGGQSAKISNNAVGGALKNFHQNSLFKQNISPFLESVNFSDHFETSLTSSKLGAVTGKLYLHPLGDILKRSLEKKAIPDVPVIIFNDNPERNKLFINELNKHIDLMVKDYSGGGGVAAWDRFLNQSEKEKAAHKARFLKILRTRKRRNLLGYLISSDSVSKDTQLVKFLIAINLDLSELNA